MKLSYDPRYNIAYLRLADSTADVESVRVSEELNVDMTPDGKVYGIELLNANQQVGAAAIGKLAVENEATGKTAEVVLP